MEKNKGVVYVLICFCLLLSGNSFSQVTLYSENFENDSGVGSQDDGSISSPGDLNWTISKNGTPDITDALDHCKVVTGFKLEWRDNASTSFAASVSWYSAVYSGEASNVTISIPYSLNAASISGTGLRFEYQLDGGSWTSLSADVMSSNGTTYSGTATNGTPLSFSTNIRIRVTGYTGNAGNAVASIDNITISGVIPTACTAPSTDPSNLSVIVNNATSARLNWTPGDGDGGSVVFVSPAALSTDVTNGSVYTADYRYNVGSVLGNGYCVYKGTGNSVCIDNLDKNTLYYFTVYTYNENGGAPCYKKNSEPSTSSTTLNVARTWYVNNNSTAGDKWCTAVGNDSGPRGKMHSPYASLEAVLLNGLLSTGDTIKVDVGNYIDATGQHIHRGLVLPALTGLKIIGAGNDKTIINNDGGADYNFLFIDRNNTELQDMRLVEFAKNTCGGPATGQVLGVAANITGVKITRVIVSDSKQSLNGCGYPIQVNSGATVTFTGGGATCNNFDGGGGIQVVGATTNVTIRDYAFVRNENMWTDGTALRVENGTVNVFNSIFMDNESANGKKGAGIYVAAGTVNVYDCLFDANKTYLAVNSVGGTIFVDGGTVKIARSTIKGHLQLGGSTSYGAGIGVAGGSVTIDSCAFNTNIGSTSRGTDFYNDGGAVVIRDCTFGSSTNTIGCVGGTTTITFSGTPNSDVSYRTGLSITANSPRYTPAPNVPSVSGSCASGILLPVELISFTSDCKNNAIDLKWETATERNNNYFTIEKADFDGIFTKIEVIEAAGNSTSNKSYQFVDKNPIDGVSYYRLTQTDFDGVTKILETISAQSNCYDKKNNATCYFNPQDDSFVIHNKFEAGLHYKIKVVNALGEIITVYEFFAKELQAKAVLQLEQKVSNAVYFVVIESAIESESVKVVVY